MREADGGFLLDRAGDGFTGLWFADKADDPGAHDLFAALRGLDPDFTGLVAAGPALEVFGARPGSFYLLRPDLHVAARWLQADAAEIRAALARCLGVPA